MCVMFACPICKAAALARAENADFPFCGGRCKMIDLGKWLGDAYSVATEQSQSSDDAGEGAS